MVVGGGVILFKPDSVYLQFWIVQLLYPPCKRIGNISCRIIPETDIDDHRVHVIVFPDSSTVRLILHLKRFVTNVNL